MYTNELRENIKKLKENPSYISYFMTMVNELDLEIGKNILEEVAAFTKQEELEEAYAWTEHRLGWIYLDSMKFEMAIATHMTAYETFLALESIEGIIAASNGLMADYATQELWDLAIEWGLKGIELAEQSQNEKAIIGVLINIATIYVKLKKYEKSKEILEQISRIDYLLSTGDKIAKYTIQALSELGLGDGDKASLSIEKAYKLARETHSMELAEILCGRGKIYTKLGDYELAKESFEEGFDFAKKNSQSNHIISISIEWAKLDINKGNYKKGIYKLLKTVNQINEIHARRELKDIYFNLSKAYKALNQSEKSLFYMEKYLEMKEEIANNQSEAWMTRLDYKKAEREASIYKFLYNQIEHLSNIGQKITSTLKLEDVMDIISREIKYIISTDVFEISFYDEAKDSLECVLCMVDNQKYDLGYIAVNANNFSSYCIKNKKNILLNDIEKECKEYLSNHKTYIEARKKEQQLKSQSIPQSTLFIPLILKDKVVGVMSVQSYQKGAYVQKDLSALQILGSYMAIALENTHLFKEVDYRATYDELTAIYNRREIISRGLALYQKEQKTTCLIMIDIDDFKHINDTYGHIIGDKVLKEVASVIRKSIRKEDLLGRYGGEEFLVVLGNRTLQEAKLTAERIRKNVESLEVKSSQRMKLQTSISIGITKCQDEKDSFEEMIKYADEALYCSKEKGKNQVNVYQKEE